MAVVGLYTPHIMSMIPRVSAPTHLGKGTDMWSGSIMRNLHLLSGDYIKS